MRRINVVVLVLILAAATGVLLAVISRMQEAERRITCENNLRQHAFALLNYHDSHLAFPAGTIRNKQLPPEKRLSWLVSTSPDLEQLFYRLDETKAWDAPENIEPIGYGMDGPVGVVGNRYMDLCPGNPNRAPAGVPGIMHYVGIGGLGQHAAELPLGYPQDGLIEHDVGVFGYDRQIRKSDVKDGLSTTLMLAETALANGAWTAGGLATVRGLDPSRLPYAGQGQQFAGTHLGGMNAVFADAHVRFLDNSMDPHVFEALATIAGGEKTDTLNGE